MQQLRPQPYIGITDFTNREQVEKILSISQEVKTGHLLGVGVMMSYKTLHGLPTRWTSAFPPKEEIADIFVDRRDVYNVIHYVDYDGVSTIEDFKRALSYAGPNVHAIQFDMIWPDAWEIRKALSRDKSGPHPIKIILQIGRKAMAAANDDINLIIERMKIYSRADCLDYVLLDKSGGEGKEMESELLFSYHQAVRRHFHGNELGIVVAGGLGPNSVKRLLAPFLRTGENHDISIDAQGKLRQSGNALDPIDWDMAAEYYAQAMQYFQGE